MLVSFRLNRFPSVFSIMYRDAECKCLGQIFSVVVFLATTEKEKALTLGASKPMFLIWCRLRESNPRPSLYEGDALPAELSRRLHWWLLALVGSDEFDAVLPREIFGAFVRSVWFVVLDFPGLTANSLNFLLFSSSNSLSVITFLLYSFCYDKSSSGTAPQFYPFISVVVDQVAPFGGLVVVQSQ